MTEIADRYRRLSRAFADEVAAVPPEGWDAPTPCVDWTVRDLVAHVVETQGLFLGFVGRSSGDGPAVAADPAGAWEVARAAVQADLDDPERATAEFEGFQGRTTFEAAVDRFLNTDLVVHGWDLARATGQDEHIDPDDVVRVRAVCEGFGEAMRDPRAFGPELDTPAGADDQTRLLAFLGRQA